MIDRSTVVRTSLFGLLALGLIPFRAAGQSPSARNQLQPRPNVILITIDTLRADHVGCYGAQDRKDPGARCAGGHGWRRV